jgi:hypothetical protein
MAISCKSRTTVEIKDLPVIESVNIGDFFIVETVSGTAILDFANFIITPSNTTFENVINQNTTNILILSSDLDTFKQETNSNFNVLSTQIVLSNTFSTFSYTTAGITQLKGNNTKIDPATSITSILQPEPVIIFFEKNFPDTNYCVSANAQFNNVPVVLAVLETTTNSITVRGYTLAGDPSFIDKGWVRITTV